MLVEKATSPRLVLRTYKGSSWQKSIVGIDWLRDLANFSGGKTQRNEMNAGGRKQKRNGEEVVDVSSSCGLALKRQKNDRSLVFCIESDGESFFRLTSLMCLSELWLVFAVLCPDVSCFLPSD